MINKTEETMKKEILQILQEINEAHDPQKIEELIGRALEIDSHDPMVLLLAAEFSHDPYERLSFLDHGIRHLEHHLAEEDMFSQANFEQLATHPLGDILVKNIALRFNTFMDLNYLHQAINEYVQLTSLEGNDVHDDARGVMASLYIGYFELAQDIYNGYESAPFTIAYPYSVFLYKQGHEKEALGIFENLLDYVPNLKDYFLKLSYGETPIAESEEDYALLNTLLQTSSLTPDAFSNLVIPLNHN